MNISTRPLDATLRKGVGPLYAVYGAEALLALEAADRIRDAARKSGCTEREIFFAEPGADWSKFGASGASLSASPLRATIAPGLLCRARPAACWWIHSISS